MCGRVTRVGYSFESYIARRYLKGAQGTSEGRQFLKLITYISVGGVALGVATLILALSIVRGFSQEIQSKVIGFGAHVQIESIRDAPLERGAILRSIAEEIDGVTLVSPVIQEFILLRRSSREIEGVSIWGTEQLPGYIAETLTDGRGDLSVSASGRPGIVIGAKLSRSLGAEVGSLVTAFSVNTAALSSGKAAPLLKQFEVRGIYETSLANFDELYVFTDLQDFCIRKFVDTTGDVDAHSFADLRSRRVTDTSDICEGDWNPLCSRDVYAGNTCHVCYSFFVAGP